MWQTFFEDRHIWRRFYHHSRTFSLAARLLPRRVQLPIATLYLFCRRVDSIADKRVQNASAKVALYDLQQTEEHLHRTLAGNPPDALLWQRLHDVNRQFGLQADPLHELIDGAKWDLSGRPIHSNADLLAYSNLVGGSIGVMMLPFLIQNGTPEPQVEDAARGLGIAMQLTNIIRDVGEDLHQLNRVYLPDDLLANHNLSAGDLRAVRDGHVPPGYPAALEEVMRQAEDLYAESTPAIQALPLRVRTGIRSSAVMYREILNEVRANGYDNLSRRAYVPLKRKLRLILHNDYERRKHSLMNPALA